MAVGGAALVAPSMALDPYPTLIFHPIPNPFAFEGSLYDDVIGPLGSVGSVLLLVSLVCAGVSILIRADKGSRIARQQIKRLAYSFILTIIGLVLVVVLYFRYLSVAAFNFFPIAVGIAVLRYRLFDIDVIINRTLVYGSLSAMLALIYVGGVVGMQAVLRAITGQESTIAVVASTLAVAALFNPLRRRIQSFVDSSFYRRKYDARKTLEAFSAKFRDETDLQALNEDLVGVVTETMQPAHVSVWLPPRRPRRASGLDRGRVGRGIMASDSRPPSVRGEPRCVPLSDIEAPKRSGSSRQGAPVRNFQMTASTNNRLPLSLLRPTWPGRPGC